MRPVARVFCVCGHEHSFHSRESGRCLLQKLDESECDCLEPTLGTVLVGDDVYDMVLRSPQAKDVKP